jgi:hypothetical protein
VPDRVIILEHSVSEAKPFHRFQTLICILVIIEK